MAAEIASGKSRVDGYQRTSVTTGAGNISLNGTRSVLSLTGALSRYSSGSLSGYGNLYGTYLLMRGRGLSASVDVDGGLGAYRGVVSGHYLKSGVRVLVGSHFWGDVSASQAYDTATYTTVGSTLGVGIQGQNAGASATIGVVQVRNRPVGHFAAGMEYHPGRLRVATQVGVVTDPSTLRFGAGATWGQLVTTWNILPSAALNFTVARLPVDVQRGLPAARSFSIGLQLRQALRTPVATDPIRPLTSVVEVIRLSNDSLRLLIALRNAKRVEIRGSFTGWQPATMQKQPNGRWSIVAAMQPGLHPIAIRIDGGPWQAPPGIPPSTDDFGEEHGLFVVQ